MSPSREQYAMQKRIFGTRAVPNVANGGLEIGHVHHMEASGLFFLRPNYDTVNVWGPAPHSLDAYDTSDASLAGVFAHTHVIFTTGDVSFELTGVFQHQHSASGPGASASALTGSMAHVHNFTLGPPPSQPGIRQCLIAWTGARNEFPWVIGVWPR